jgi:hypothetical protein
MVPSSLTTSLKTKNGRPWYFILLPGTHLRLRSTNSPLLIKSLRLRLCIVYGAPTPITNMIEDNTNNAVSVDMKVKTGVVFLHVKELEQSSFAPDLGHRCAQV